VDQQDRAFMTVFGAVLGFLVLVTIFIIFLARTVVDEDATSQDSLRTERMIQQLQKPGRVIVSGTAEAEQEQAQLAGGTAAAAAGGEQAGVSGEQLYAQVCASCHDQGLLNAPKLGEADVWQPRYEQGMDTLVQHAIDGFNQMPPQGQAPGATEANIRESIVYMLEQSHIELATSEQAVEAPAAPEQVTEAPATQEQAAAEQPAQQAATQEQAAAEQPAEQAATQEQAAAEQPAEQAIIQAPAPVQAAAASATNVSTEPPPADLTLPGDLALNLPASLDLTQGQQVYENVCRFCHLGNIPTAPKLGDTEAWAPRLAQGWEVLTGHVLNGYKGMPAKGGRTDLADEQILNALGYMLSNAQ